MVCFQFKLSLTCLLPFSHFTAPQEKAVLIVENKVCFRLGRTRNSSLTGLETGQTLATTTPHRIYQPDHGTNHSHNPKEEENVVPQSTVWFWNHRKLCHVLESQGREITQPWCHKGCLNTILS